MGTEPTTEPPQDNKPDTAPSKAQNEGLGAAFHEIMDIMAGNIYAVAFSAVLVSVIVAVIPYALIYFLSSTPPAGMREFGKEYGFGALFLMPVVQGLLTGYWAGRHPLHFVSYVLTPLLILAIDIGCAILLVHEGAICLLMAFPLFWALIGIGMGIGKLIAHFVNKRTLHATVLPLMALAFAHDAFIPPSFSNAISDAVTVNAPPEAVWRYVVQYPLNEKPPEYWLWKVGLPEPVQSVANARKVGAARECRFTNNVVFKEKITELVPNEVLTFDITEQPRDPEIIGHFSLDKGQMILEPNKDGTTTIIATSWYHLYVSPAFYFDWWAADIVRNVHFRVLNHIKGLAETDQAKK